MRRLRLLLGALAIAACAPAPVWERSGATESERGRDDLECRARADAERHVPTVRRPARRPGDETVELAPRGGFDFEAYRACMEGRGYRQAPRLR